MLLIGGLLATASSANASILSSSRINFAMGREKIISPSVNEIHQRFGTPYKSILITGAFIIGFLLFGDLKLLSTAGSVLHLIVYGLLNIALIVMREAEPADYDPDFEVPLYPFVPIIGTISSFALIAYIEPFVILLSAALVIFAGVWYLLYARQRVESAGVFVNWILHRSEEMPDAAVAAADSIRPAASVADGGDFHVMVPEALAATIGLYTLSEISLGKAGERTGFTRWKMEEILSEADVKVRLGPERIEDLEKRTITDDSTRTSTRSSTRASSRRVNLIAGRITTR